MSLLVAPCSYDAATIAVMRWHYSGKMPAGKLIRFGVWEGERFAGAVIFGRGGSTRLGSPYGLDQTEVCELVRVALRDHDTFVSQIVSICLKKLRTANPRMRLVVSFADTAQGHHGGIYQAGNWVYVGASGGDSPIWLNGKKHHSRSVISKYGTKRMEWLRAHVDPAARWLPRNDKHRYLYPLDRAMRRKVMPLAKPYPRGGSVDSDTSGLRPERAGATPAHRSTTLTRGA